jgi:hypothetical protein
MSLLSKLFGAKPPSTPAGRTAPNEVVADFGDVLATRSPFPSHVADLSELPYPKEEIKAAILAMFTVTNDTKLREHLKFAYVALAHWQPSVGSARQPLNLSALDLTRSVSEIAGEVMARQQEMQKWEAIVQSDQESLIGELRRIGLWQ